MKRARLLFVALAIGTALTAAQAWGRGFAGGHSSGGGNTGYRGSAPAGSGSGGFNRVPSASHVTGSGGFQSSSSAAIHSNSVIKTNPVINSGSGTGAQFQSQQKFRTPTVNRGPVGPHLDSGKHVLTSKGPNAIHPNGLHPNGANNNHWTQWHNHSLHNNWYHGNWHGNWDNHWHQGWNYWGYNPWLANTAFWGVTGWMWGSSVYNWGYYPYYNPYCVQPLTFGNTVVNYQQPLNPIDYGPPADGSDGSAQANVVPLSNEAMTHADAARQLFHDENSPQALQEVEQALSTMPGDQALHELRALILFSMGQYQPAAAAIHSILAVGPGWDWTTMIALYPNADVYTRQLRGLEAFCRDNPNDAAPRFLLAYQYLTCGHTPSAVNQLKAVVRLMPQDRVASQLLSMITAPAGQNDASDASKAVPPDAGKPGPEEPHPTIGGDSKPANSVPPNPIPGGTNPAGTNTAGTNPAGATPAVNPATLVGTWTAHPQEGATIQLTVTPDSKFTWKFTQADHTQTFTGMSTVPNNLLMLQQANGESMVGRVVPEEGRGFHFYLIGGPPNDPGLAFTP